MFELFLISPLILPRDRAQPNCVKKLYLDRVESLHKTCRDIYPLRLAELRISRKDPLFPKISAAKEAYLCVSVRLFRCWLWEDRLVQSRLVQQHWDHVFDGVWTYVCVRCCCVCVSSCRQQSCVFHPARFPCKELYRIPINWIIYTDFREALRCSGWWCH